MTLTLSALQKAAVERNEKSMKCAGWAQADWMTALVGEVGEMANLMKKVRRGDFTLEEARQKIAHEIADIQGYLPLLAQSLGIDLEAATVEKFDIVSVRVGSPIKLGSIEPFTAKRRHQWGPSRVGHGEQQCVHCLITNREAAVIAPEFCI